MKVCLVLEVEVNDIKGFLSLGLGGVLRARDCQLQPCESKRVDLYKEVLVALVPSLQPRRRDQLLIKTLTGQLLLLCSDLHTRLAWGMELGGGLFKTRLPQEEKLWSLFCCSEMTVRISLNALTCGLRSISGDTRGSVDGYKGLWILFLTRVLFMSFALQRNSQEKTQQFFHWPFLAAGCRRAGVNEAPHWTTGVR